MTSGAAPGAARSSRAADHAPAGARVLVMVTCLGDAFFDDVARATVEVLEYLGCQVDVPRDQTCCGQPAFNTGDWASARRVARHALSVFSGDEPVVAPSGSCARMLSHAGLILFEGEEDLAAARRLASRSWELADFIVRGLGVTHWGGHFEGDIAFHRSCHGRGTSYAESAAGLLRSIDGVRLVEFEEGEQCCGFGGTFASAFPGISRAVGALKLDHLLRDRPAAIVSGDMGCLMQLDGLARRQGRSVRMLHVAQVLRDALGLPATGAQGGEP